MAETSSEHERTEPATPHKLEEARKKGQVAKSLEMNSFAAMSIAAATAAIFGTWSFHQLLVESRRLLDQAGDWTFEPGSMVPQLQEVATSGIVILSPLLALMVIGMVLISLAQTSPIFSAEPLKPDFDRLNPASGLKRLLSARTVFELIKVLIKLSVYGSVIFFVFQHLIKGLPELYRVAPQAIPGKSAELIMHLTVRLLIAMAFIALVDLLFTRWEYAKKMRMSHRELKEEHRRREGDPLIRKRLRELQRELRKKSSSIHQVKESDVLITNPTHVAVAIKYRRGHAPAPEVVAKGLGHLASSMKDVAFHHGIPVITDPKLARALYADVPIGHFVPEKFYEIVALVLKRVYDMRARQISTQESRT